MTWNNTVFPKRKVVSLPSTNLLGDALVSGRVYVSTSIFMVPKWLSKCVPHARDSCCCVGWSVLVGGEGGQSPYVDKFQMFGKITWFFIWTSGVYICWWVWRAPRNRSCGSSPSCLQFLLLTSQGEDKCQVHMQNTTSVRLKNIPYSTQKVTVSHLYHGYSIA